MTTIRGLMTLSVLSIVGFALAQTAPPSPAPSSDMDGLKIATAVLSRQVEDQSKELSELRALVLNNPVVDRLGTMLNLYFILLSIVLAILAFIGYGSLRGLRRDVKDRVDAEVSKILPSVEEVKRLRDVAQSIIGDLSASKSDIQDKLADIEGYIQGVELEASPSLLYAKALSKCQAGEDPANACRDLIQLLGSDASADDFLASALLARDSLRNMPLAKKLLEAGLKKSPQHPVLKAVWLEQSAAEIAFEDAEKELRELVRRNPRNQAVIKALCNFYIELDQYEGLRDAMLEVSRMNPTLGLAYRNLAVAAEELGDDPKNIVQYYESAVKYDPRDDVTYFRFAVYLRDTGQLDRALEVVEKAIKYDPTDGRNHVLKGDLLHERGNVDDAVGSLETGVELLGPYSTYAIKAKILLKALGKTGRIVPVPIRRTPVLERDGEGEGPGPGV